MTWQCLYDTNAENYVCDIFIIPVIDLDCLMDIWYIQYFHNTVKYRVKQEVAKVATLAAQRNSFRNPEAYLRERKKTGISWASNLIAGEMRIYQCLKMKECCLKMFWAHSIFRIFWLIQRQQCYKPFKFRTKPIVALQSTSRCTVEEKN